MERLLPLFRDVLLKFRLTKTDSNSLEWDNFHDLLLRQALGHALAFHSWSVQEPLLKTIPLVQRPLLRQYASEAQHAESSVPLWQGVPVSLGVPSGKKHGLWQKDNGIQSKIGGKRKENERNMAFLPKQRKKTLMEKEKGRGSQGGWHEFSTKKSMV